MNPDHPDEFTGRPLRIDEIRLVADLRVMHAKVDDLYNLARRLQERHDETDINTYADHTVLAEDIRKVDELYLWFVKLKEMAEKTNRKRVNSK